jgi:hypothetical protein
LALDADSSDARAIMAAVSARPSGDRALSRVKMTIKDGSGARERTLSLRSKIFADAIKTLIVIEAPADVRNTAFLSVDYRAAGRADEQWLYLPNLQRVTRVPSSGRAGPFMGSDFTYADLAKPDFDDYDLKMVDTAAKVDGEACWLIEATPRSAAAKETTGYDKTHVWVSKAKLLPLQIKAWVSKGHRLKYLKAADVRSVGGIWTPYRLQARTMRDAQVESETLIQLLNVQYDAVEVQDGDFTQRRLEQGL